MSCPIDISHAGTSLSPLSLFTLLTAITNHTHVHRLLFRHEEHEFSIDFHLSITVFTPNETENRTGYRSSFCHFQGANGDGFRAWLSICRADQILMILNAPFASFTLNQANGSFSFLPKTNDTCDNLSYHLSKRESNNQYDSYLHHQSLPEYFKEYSRIFPRKRYVEFALFADYTLFYDALNIEIRLVYTQILQVPMFDFSDHQKLLESFSTFLLRFHKDKHFDHAQLMIGGNHFGTELGLANEGRICSPQGYSVSYSKDVGGSDALRMGHILAHELGHSLGMLHDTQFDYCECEMQHCIMFPSSKESFNFQFWSKCSLTMLEHMYQVEADYCLWNEPGVMQKMKILEGCGNGIVEQGEDCDCGPLVWWHTRSDENIRGCITHNCCDKDTCKFRVGAKCAFGSCCDVTTCSIAGPTQICRGAKNSCDLPEFCDGVSVDCAADKHRTDGEKCPDDQDAICYGGRCASRKLQCKRIFGGDANASPEHCFNNNICKPLQIDKNGFPCEEQDKLCGLLHCNVPNYSNDPSKRYNMGFMAGSDNKNGCARTHAYYQKGHKEHNSGMTLDGASCGDGKMCLNQKCVPSLAEPDNGLTETPQKPEPDNRSTETPHMPEPDSRSTETPHMPEPDSRSTETPHKPDPGSGSTAGPAIYIAMAFVAIRV